MFTFFWLEESPTVTEENDQWRVHCPANSYISPTMSNETHIASHWPSLCLGGQQSCTIYKQIPSIFENHHEIEGNSSAVCTNINGTFSPNSVDFSPISKKKANF
jgi:hypothetical protein